MQQNGLQHGIGIAAGTAITTAMGVAALVMFVPYPGGLLALVTWAIWVVALLLPCAWAAYAFAPRSRRLSGAGILTCALLSTLSVLAGVVLFINIMLNLAFANAS